MMLPAHEMARAVATPAPTAAAPPDVTKLSTPLTTAVAPISIARSRTRSFLATLTAAVS